MRRRIRSAGTGTGRGWFWSAVAIAVGVRTALLGAGCCVAAALWWQFAHHGAGALAAHGFAMGGALVLATVSVAGGLLAGRSLIRALRATIGFARHVRRHTLTLPSGAAAIAGELGLADRVAMIGSATVFAVTYGLSRPRVLVSSALVGTLEPAELRAVLAHEAEHVHGHDPLRTLVLRAVGLHQFYLPLLADLRKRFALARELAADRRARATAGTAPLAGALLKVVDGPVWLQTTPTAGMGTAAMLDARIAQLEDRPARATRPSTGRLALTIAGIVLLGWALAGSVLLLAITPLTCMPSVS